MVRQMSNIVKDVKAWGVAASFFFEFSKITYKAFVVMKGTQEKCGFSFGDNWGINIEKNDKWEANRKN